MSLNLLRTDPCSLSVLLDYREFKNLNFQKNDPNYAIFHYFPFYNTKQI